MKIGMYGSPAHVMTNDKVSDKSACLKELYKERAKDSFKVMGGTAAAVGVAVNADNIKKFAGKLVDTPIKEVAKNGVSATKKGVEIAKNAVKNPGKAATKVINSVKTNLKPAKIIKSFKNLPAPAKAAIAAGVALFGLYSASKAGYVEGKHETK